MTSQTGEHRDRLLGYAVASVSALSYAGGALVSRKVVSEQTVPVVASAVALLFGTMLVGGLFYRQTLKDIRLVRGKSAWILVALAGLGSAWGVNFLFLAFEKGSVVLVAPLVSISPLITIVLASIFLKELERITWRTYLGGGLVVLGVALISIGQQI